MSLFDFWYLSMLRYFWTHIYFHLRTHLLSWSSTQVRSTCREWHLLLQCKTRITAAFVIMRRNTHELSRLQTVIDSLVIKIILTTWLYSYFSLWGQLDNAWLHSMLDFCWQWARIPDRPYCPAGHVEQRVAPATKQNDKKFSAPQK